MSTTTTAAGLALTRRLRRLRRSAAMRGLVREARLSPEQFILPLFVTEGTGVRKPIGSMPGVAQMSVDEIVAEAKGPLGDGVSAVLLFGLPPRKDDAGSGAYDQNGPVQEAVRAL